MAVGITIEPVRPEYAAALQEVFYRSWLGAYPNEEYGITVEDIEDFYKEAFTEKTIQARSERLANLPDNMKVLVAKDRDKVVGVCRVMLYPDKNQLQAIYILPEYQGKGTGTRLWNEVRKLLDPTKDTVVQVAVYNKSAINFYESIGFKDNGKRFSEEKFRMKSGNLIPEMEMVMPKGDF